LRIFFVGYVDSECLYSSSCDLSISKRYLLSSIFRVAS